MPPCDFTLPPWSLGHLGPGQQGSSLSLIDFHALFLTCLPLLMPEGHRQGWARAPALPAAGCVTVSKSLHHSKPHVLSCDSSLSGRHLRDRRGKSELNSVCSKTVTCLAVLEGSLVLVRVCDTHPSPFGWKGVDLGWGERSGCDSDATGHGEGLDFRCPFPFHFPFVCITFSWSFFTDFKLQDQGWGVVGGPLPIAEDSRAPQNCIFVGNLPLPVSSSPFWGSLQPVDEVPSCPRATGV